MRAHARRVVERIAAGERLPLAGVPVAIKDIMCLTGRARRPGRRSSRTSSPVHCDGGERLLDAGALPIGKTNLDEFAMGSSTRTPLSPDAQPVGPRPRARRFVGGSAVAVGGFAATLSLGSDTGGSIRQPAAFCGVVGLKPTYGRVSRYGLIAFASSLDQIGPFARRVADAALASDAIAGKDPLDATSVDRAVEPTADGIWTRTCAACASASSRSSGSKLDAAIRRGTKRRTRTRAARRGARRRVAADRGLRLGDVLLIAPAECSSTSRGSTACGTACASTARTSARCTSGRARRGSAPR